MRRLINLLLIYVLLLSVCLNTGIADSTFCGEADNNGKTVYNARNQSVEDLVQDMYKRIKQQSGITQSMDEVKKMQEEAERLKNQSSQVREYIQSQVSETPREMNGRVIFIILGILAIVLIPMIIMELYHRVQGRTSRYELQTLQQIGVTYQNDREYVDYVAAWLKLKGYTDIFVSPKAGNHSVDIIATDPKKIRTAVLCKRSSEAVGDRTIVEAAEGMNEYKCEAAMVVTNSIFTRRAFDAAKKKEIILIQRLM